MFDLLYTPTNLNIISHVRRSISIIRQVLCLVFPRGLFLVIYLFYFLSPSRKHAYVMLTPLNPTFI